jgi:signal transduction histidine kinase
VVALVVAGRGGRAGPAFLLAALGWATFVFGGRLFPSAGLVVPGVLQSVLLAFAIVVLVGASESSRVRAAQLAQAAKARAEEERARTEQRRRQASEERLLIARELHDVIGHHLSLINVQAGVGLHLMETRPEQARESLAAIKQASAEALREVRAVLGALQTAEDGAAPRAPAPRLDRIGELIAEVEAAGLTVGVRVEGEPGPVPAEVDRAAYRIVQEALTNVRRHAGPSAAATVVIGYGERELTVRVEDDGGGAVAVPPAGEPEERGAGLPGMRERATALGGSFAAGWRPEGGFRVAATLPLTEGAE